MGEPIAQLNHDFGAALILLRGGYRVARSGWNGKGMWLALWHDNEVYFGFPAVDAWIGMKTADNKFVPWLASQTDILAEDWSVVEVAPTG